MTRNLRASMSDEDFRRFKANKEKQGFDTNDEYISYLMDLDEQQEDGEDDN